MAANESYELVVEMVADGADETADQVEGVGDSFDDASAEVENNAGNMEDSAAAWQGMVTSIMTGLAVAAAGLATQVPVLGGLFQGLVAIIESIAFQMDSVLRPILQPVADGFFQIADAIFNMEGPAGALVGILGTMAAIFAALFFIVGGVPAAIAAVAAGLVLLLDHFGLLSPLITMAQVAIGGAIAVLQTLADVVTGVVSGALDLLGSAFRDLADAAFGWGQDLIREFANGILDMATAPIDAAQDVIDGVTGAIGFDLRSNDRMAERWGEDLLSHFSVGMERGARMLDMSINASGGGGGDGGRPASDTVVVENNMDGKRVNSTLQSRRGARRKSRQRDGA